MHKVICMLVILHHILCQIALFSTTSLTTVCLLCDSHYLKAECLFTIMHRVSDHNDQLQMCCLNCSTFRQKDPWLWEEFVMKASFIHFPPLFKDNQIKGQVSDQLDLRCVLGLNALMISIFMKIKQPYTAQWIFSITDRGH